MGISSAPVHTGASLLPRQMMLRPSGPAARAGGQPLSAAAAATTRRRLALLLAAALPNHRQRHQQHFNQLQGCQRLSSTRGTAGAAPPAAGGGAHRGSRAEIVGVGKTAIGKLGKPATLLMVEALELAVRDAGCQLHDLDGLVSMPSLSHPQCVKSSTHALQTPARHACRNTCKCSPLSIWLSRFAGSCQHTR